MILYANKPEDLVIIKAWLAMRLPVELCANFSNWWVTWCYDSSVDQTIRPHYGFRLKNEV